MNCFYIITSAVQLLRNEINVFGLLGSIVIPSITSSEFSNQLEYEITAMVRKTNIKAKYDTGQFHRLPFYMVFRLDVNTCIWKLKEKKKTFVLF